MSKLITKTAKCLRCNSLQKYDVYEIDNCIDLQNYNLFKNPCINKCTQCGYLFFDLEQSYSPQQSVDTNVFNLCVLASKLLETNLPNETKVQLYATIFDKQKLILSKQIMDYLEDPSPEDKQKLYKQKNEFNKFCNSLLMFLQKNKFDFDDKLKQFFILFNAEVLAAIGNVEDSKKLIENLNLEEKLDDFMQEVIMIGDVTCCNL